jgi:hypothetical protein
VENSLKEVEVLGTLLGEGPFRKPYKIECLLPDSTDIAVVIDGVEICLEQELPAAGLSVEEEGDTAPRITRMYWAYWNGEKYVELEENGKPRYYVDLAFIVETDNYEDGDIIRFVLKRNDKLLICDDVSEIYLEGAVVGNKIVFEDPFHGYALNLYPQGE